MGTFTIPDAGSVYIVNTTTTKPTPINGNIITADNPVPGSFGDTDVYCVRIHSVRKQKNMTKKVVFMDLAESPASKSAAENTAWFVDLKRNQKVVTITGTLKHDALAWGSGGFGDVWTQLSHLDYIFNYPGNIRVVWGRDGTDNARDNDIWVRGDTGFTGSIIKIQIDQTASLESIDTPEIPVIIQIHKSDDKTK